MSAEPVDAVLHRRVAELEKELLTTRRSRDFYQEQAEEAYRALRSPHAEEFTTQTHRTHGGEIASALRQAERGRADLKQAQIELEATRLELEELRPARAPESPKPYGGQKAGDRCYCSPDARLEEEMSAGLYSGLLQSFLFCPRCKFARREDGAVFCPVCVNFPASWVGGTDHDPRPECGTCGTIQPGWGPLERTP